MSYYIKVRNADSTEWVTPMFPKCSHDIDVLRKECLGLQHVYDFAAIFLDEEMIEGFCLAKDIENET